MTRTRRAKFTDFEPMRKELLQLRFDNETLKRVVRLYLNTYDSDNVPTPFQEAIVISRARVALGEQGKG